MKRSTVAIAVLMSLVWLVPVGVGAQGDEVTIVTYGESVQGTITGDHYEYLYQFAGNAGDSIYASVVELSNSYLNVELVIRDSAGQIVLEEGWYSAVDYLGPYTLPADGDYTVQVSRYGGADGSGTGNFAFIVDLADVQGLTPGTPVEGMLDQPAAIQFWSYDGAEGDVMSISAEGNGLEFVLIDPSGWQIAHEGPGTTPVDNFVLLEETGVFTLLLQTGHLDGSNYALDVVVYDPVELTRGEAAAGEIGGAVSAGYFSAYVTEDELLRLEIVSDDVDFDATVYVYDSEGWLTESAYDSDEDEFNLLVEPWVAAEEGEYYIVVSPDEDYADAIPYTVTIRESELALLSLGEMVTDTLNNDTPRFRYALPGEEGQQWRVILQQVDGECAPELRIDNRDEMGLYFDNRWATLLQTDITLPVGGYYVFQVERGLYRGECVFELVVDLVE